MRLTSNEHKISTPQKFWYTIPAKCLNALLKGLLATSEVSAVIINHCVHSSNIICHQLGFLGPSTAWKVFQINSFFTWLTFTWCREIITLIIILIQVFEVRASALSFCATMLFSFSYFVLLQCILWPQVVDTGSKAAGETTQIDLRYSQLKAPCSGVSLSDWIMPGLCVVVKCIV